MGIHRILCRFQSTNPVTIKPGLKLSETINLPRTKFPLRLSQTKRAEVQDVVNKLHLGALYRWQRENLTEPEFLLHDGPPYANGDTHVGHAVNKILKDLIMKTKICRGQKVHYIPGWDCHGLPIELKALSDSLTAPPMVVREKARKFAVQALERQKSDFSAWGVGADWSEGLYKTIDSRYVQNQLQVFHEMYKKDLIYRDLKPVHWSPSSRTALAEAELEYNDNYVSPSLYMRVKLLKRCDRLQKYSTIFGLIWTTTPWTLPANQAICFNSALEYSVVESSGEIYIIASNLLEQLQGETGHEFEVLESFNGCEFEGATYEQPITRTEKPFLLGSHVQDTKGTGLVHTAPAHGMDDFLVCLSNQISTECIVDEAGKYTEEAPSFLHGKYVLTEGNQAVLEYLNEAVFKLGKITHSYPIDWRTKKPIIFRASKQWFIDTGKIKEKAISELSRVKLYPKHSAEINKTHFTNQLAKRPYWCISRQRCWGVPIPVFYTDTKDVVINENTIKDISNFVNETGNIDFWWKRSAEEILSPDTRKNLPNLEKGSDILDIWFDSGVSWYCALDGRPADLYLEGVDQFTGWFQSSLMTSVALQDKSPYKSIFVHGFTVDEKGLKMSKSIGNVVSPKDIIDKYGIDTMRWWIAAHSVQHSSIPVGAKVLTGSAETVHKIRATLRFMNGYIKETHDINGGTFIDRIMLHSLQKFDQTLTHLYDEYQFNSATAAINNFITNEISAFYLHLIKDRLYCGGSVDSEAARDVITQIYEVTCKALWPIVPFLVEESWSYHSKESFYKKSIQVDAAWKDETLEPVLEVINAAKHEIYKNKTGNSWLFDVNISAPKDKLELLGRLTNEELCEVFQVQTVSLNVGDEWKVSTETKDRCLCPRCRRFEVSIPDTMCNRCQMVLSEKTCV